MRCFEVGVIVARKPLRMPWADHAWLPYAVLPAAPNATPGTHLGTDGDGALFYAGPCELALHPSSAPNYRDNLASGRPSLWVALRLGDDGSCAVAGVSADPYEGEALTEGIGGLVEALPMPAEIRAGIAAFCDAFPAERPFFRRERDRADPDALGSRRRTPADGRREDA